ncbi:unnamed protein product [Notodromas monacha]|uniref:Uncharacterized protein n=1 Tax=Notodromas monacha TaxID=399045 RepID=A0A7R9BW21_9CRUS|nr:unnamed protein product [Notodromas monacha]CAG0921171.1 unnamed protein product [Notodromas monacha]
MIGVVRQVRVTHNVMSTHRVPVSGGPVEMRMRSKLIDQLEPEHIEILNESHKHNTPPGAETHFKVRIVSEKFDGKSLLKKHQMVHEVLKEELEAGVHALSIEAKTPSNWDKNVPLEPSPPCRGGFGL